MMKKLCLRIAVALVAFAGLGISANAQVNDQVVLTVPFDFKVGGTTLPAGTYRVNRIWDDPWLGLVLSSYENRAGAFVLPVEVKSASVHKPQVTFETVGDDHFLSQIQTADNVYNISVPRALVLLAGSKSQTQGAPSGSSAGAN